MPTNLARATDSLESGKPPPKTHRAAIMSFYRYVSHHHQLVLMFNPRCGCNTLRRWFSNLVGIPGDERRRRLLQKIQRFPALTPLLLLCVSPFTF